MLRSMTGFGNAEISLPNKKIIIEIKSLNSKNADINIKTPSSFYDKELEMRQIVEERLERGKIEMTVTFDSTEDSATAALNKNVIKSYFNQMREISSELNLPENENFLRAIMRLPDILKLEKPLLNEKDWEDLKSTLNAALKALENFRLQEGKSIEEDLRLRINNISVRLDGIGKYEPVRIEKLRARLMTQIQELNKNIEVDTNRFEQEIIYFLEKIDITEEKLRLANHLKYFMETMDLNESVGKKLGFISQEIGREINTLGSKANDYNIQKLVVEMKDELEKIKEQLQNIL